MADHNTLSDQEIQEKLDELELWGLVGDHALGTRIEFDNYKEAAFFANMVYSLAEEMSHHPKVTVEYGAVTIDVETHEADDLTAADFEMAEAIEEKLGSTGWD